MRSKSSRIFVALFAALSFCVPALAMAQATSAVPADPQASAQAAAQGMPPAPAQTPAQAKVQAEALAMAQAQAQASTMVKDAPTSLNLKQAVEYGLANNPTMVSSRAQLKSSEYLSNSALADFFPTATASYGFSRYGDQPKAPDGTPSSDQTTWTARLNLHQPVFTGFRLLNYYQKTRLANEQSEAKLAQTELALIGAIQAQYISHLKAKMDVKSAQDSVERMRSQLKVTQAFFDVGLKPKLDVLQAEVDLATADQNLLTAKNSLDTTRAKLNSLLNLPLEAPVEYVGELAYTPYTQDLMTSLNKAYSFRPDILIGVKTVQMAEKDAGIAASEFYPQISADLDTYRRGDHPDVNGSPNMSNTSKSYWTVGANASWTFFQWGSTYFKTKSSNETVNQVRADLDNTRLGAGFEVKQGMLNQRAAADRITVARKSVEAAQEAYRMALARYQAQVGTNTDVLIAQSSLSSSEAQLSQALSDYETAISNLYVAMGEKNLALDIR